MTTVIPADGLPRLLRGTDDLDDVPVFEDMVLLDPHLGPGVDGIQESFANLGVHLEREIVGGRSFFHEERIRQDIALLVAVMVFILYRVDDDHVEKFEDRRLIACWTPVPLHSFMTLGNLCEPRFLGRGEGDSIRQPELLDLPAGTGSHWQPRHSAVRARRLRSQTQPSVLQVLHEGCRSFIEFVPDDKHGF